MLYDTLDEETEEVPVPTEDVGIFQRMKNFFTGFPGTGIFRFIFFKFFSPCPLTNRYLQSLSCYCLYALLTRLVLFV